MRYGIRGRELARFAVGTNNTNGFEVPEVFMVTCAEFDIMGRVGRGREMTGFKGFRRWIGGRGGWQGERVKHGSGGFWERVN